MGLAKYEVKMRSGYRWTFYADLAQASAPLRLAAADGEPVSTQYQTVDARHDAYRAAELLWPLESDGEDYGDDVACVH